MKEKIQFITDLCNSTYDIAATDEATWKAGYSGETPAGKILDVMYADARRTAEQTSKEFCQWLIDQSLVYARQSIPSEDYDIYIFNADEARSDGEIRRSTRKPLTLPPTTKQAAVRDIFRDAVNCFNKQPYKGVPWEPYQGPKSREKWYEDATGSGLWYFTYFMQQTLDTLFGPGSPNQYPFPGGEEPEWCEALLRKCAVYTVTPFNPDIGPARVFDTDVPFLPGGGSLTLEFYLAPDSTGGDPGNINVGTVEFVSVGLDADGEEVTDYINSGPYSLPSDWGKFTVTVPYGEGAVRISTSVHLEDLDGDFYFYLGGWQTLAFAYDCDPDHAALYDFWLMHDTWDFSEYQDRA